MPTDETILNEIESAIAFCEGFMDRLIKFKKEVTKGAQPKKKRQALSDEERRRNSAQYFGSLTKKAS